jgi:hypothetical protein
VGNGEVSANHALFRFRSGLLGFRWALPLEPIGSLPVSGVLTLRSAGVGVVVLQCRADQGQVFIRGYRVSSAFRIAVSWRALLHKPADCNTLTTLHADERLYGAEAGKSVQRSTMGAMGAANLAGRKLHQPCTGTPDGHLSDGHRIDHSVAHITGEISQLTAFLNNEVALAIHSGGDFVLRRHAARQRLRVLRVAQPNVPREISAERVVWCHTAKP